MTINRAAALLLATAALTVVFGCSKSDPVGQVSGKVTYRGQPVPQGLVMFTEPEKKLFYSAELDQAGNYTVVTAGKAGLPVGSYEVTVNPPVPEDSQVGMMLKPAQMPQYLNIPQRYRLATSSGLRLEVKEGENPPFNIQMQ